MKTLKKAYTFVPAPAPAPVTPAPYHHQQRRPSPTPRRYTYQVRKKQIFLPGENNFGKEKTKCAWRHIYAPYTRER